MFKITYMVDDKRLPDMLRSCSGHVYNLEVVPVTNAEPVKGKTNGTSAPRVREANGNHKDYIGRIGWTAGHQFRSKDLAAVLPGLGMNKSSAWYVIATGIKDKTVKRVGVGLYEVR